MTTTPEPVKTYREYSTAEEIANIITHGLGVILGIGAFILLLLKGQEYNNLLYTVSVCIYSLTLIWTYSTSTLYHSAFKARVKIKNIFHLMDHTAIYLFIAGTYTPVALFALPGSWKYGILGGIWALAVVGVVFKVVSIGRFNWLSTVFYLLMGWMIVIAAKPLINNADPVLVYWIVAGGVCYSMGVVFFMWDRLKYSHAVWHVLVLAGSICHFIGIYGYLEV
ncbi:MAG: hemolysin III family protein [Owenweeksia sp.]